MVCLLVIPTDTSIITSWRHTHQSWVRVAPPSDYTSGISAYAAYLYYYSSYVRKNLSSKFDENLPLRSQFDTDHRVDFSTPTSCQSATFVRLLFPFVLYDKKSSKNHKCDESVSIGVIDEVRSANDDPNALLQINR